MLKHLQIYYQVIFICIAVIMTRVIMQWFPTCQNDSVNVLDLIKNCLRLFFRETQIQ